MPVMMTWSSCLRLHGVALVLLSATVANAEVGPLVVNHRARVVLDPAAHTVAVTDTLAVAASLPDSFSLHRALRVIEVTGGGFAPCEPLPPAPTGSDSGYRIALARKGGSHEPGMLVCRYAGECHEATADVVFTRENVGREIEATVGEEGIYLSSEARWLPTVAGALVTTRLTVDTPLGWEPVTNGVCRAREEKDGRLITVWEEANPVDGVALVAGRYTARRETVAGASGPIDISVWLLQDDPKLAATYLERTRAYLAMYEEMIGPYPFGKFATVENWFPTGYGFPSWTLLGGAVMRLPFIPTTSFGHEVCHNWWGNSVYVAEAGGNWCEGLTTYCADYHYKELESPAAAREYRRNLLKDYAAYVRDPGKDAPLSQFKARHSGATRAVGYGKAMMVFHQAARAAGPDAFAQALRRVYAERRFQRAAWDDFFAALAAASGRDFTTYRAQWLERTGAPVLSLTRAQKRGDRVTVALAQADPVYDLELPLVFATEKGEAVERLVRLDRAEQSFTLEVPGAVSVAVDPDHHVFRKLAPAEIEPTIAQVLSEAAPLFVLPAGTDAGIAAAEAFAAAFVENGTPQTVGGGAPPVDVPPGSSPTKVLINPRPDVLAERTAGLPGGQLAVAGDLAFVAGQRFDLRQHDLIFAAGDPRDAECTDLVVLCREPARLPALASRIGHYGKYSYLVFPAGRGEVGKGNWPVAAGPLTAKLVDVP